MKVLVATTETQGAQPGDHSRTVEGELVTPWWVECSPAECAHGRGFTGLASGASTTTAMVAELAGVDRGVLRAALADAIERAGWVDLDDWEVDEAVTAHLVCIDAVCSAYPVGTVVSRWGARVFSRPAAAAA